MIIHQLNCALVALALCAGAQAQFTSDADGIDCGPLVLRPSLEEAGAYDNRVIRSIAGSGAKGDFYADTAAALELANPPSVYDLLVRGRYGYRAYLDYNRLNDSFYTLAASLQTDKKPLLWGTSADYTKSLDYNLTYDPDTGQQPDSILSDRSRTRLNAQARVSYDTDRFTHTALVPGYSFQYYRQEYESDGSLDEWQIHNGSLVVRYRYTPRTRLYGGVTGAFQSNEVEDGYLATIVAGVDHRLTEKTSWMAELGYAVADYDLSGSDQGVVSNLRGNWRVTPKVSTYVFGGNNYYPGYSGDAARMVYRLGYGAAWQPVEKFRLSGAVLHDYQEQIGDNTGSYINSPYDTLRNFIDLQARYNPLDRLALVAGLRLNDDQYEPLQSIISLKVLYTFY